MGRPVVSPDLIRQVVRQFASGWTDKAIAQDHEVSKSTVNMWVVRECERRGLPDRRRLTLVLHAIARGEIKVTPTESGYQVW